MNTMLTADIKCGRQYRSCKSAVALSFTVPPVTKAAAAAAAISQEALVQPVDIS